MYCENAIFILTNPPQNMLHSNFNSELALLLFKMEHLWLKYILLTRQNPMPVPDHFSRD